MDLKSFHRNYLGGWVGQRGLKNPYGLRILNQLEIIGRSLVVVVRKGLCVYFPTGRLPYERGVWGDSEIRS